MEEILEKYPHLAEGFFVHLENKSLISCKMASRAWRNSINNQKLIWIRMIENYIGNMLPENWRRAVNKTPTSHVKDLAMAVHQHFEKNESFESDYQSFLNHLREYETTILHFSSTLFPDVLYCCPSDFLTQK